MYRSMTPQPKYKEITVPPPIMLSCPFTRKQMEETRTSIKMDHFKASDYSAGKDNRKLLIQYSTNAYRVILLHRHLKS